MVGAVVSHQWQLENLSWILSCKAQRRTSGDGNHIEVHYNTRSSFFTLPLNKSPVAPSILFELILKKNQWWVENLHKLSCTVAYNWNSSQLKVPVFVWQEGGRPGEKAWWKSCINVTWCHTCFTWANCKLNLSFVLFVQTQKKPFSLLFRYCSGILIRSSIVCRLPRFFLFGYNCRWGV